MINQEYLDSMTSEERRRHDIKGTAGIVRLAADLIESENIAVNPDTLLDDGKRFSFEYEKHL